MYNNLISVENLPFDLGTKEPADSKESSNKCDEEGYKVAKIEEAIFIYHEK